MENLALSPLSASAPLDRVHHSPFRQYRFTLILALFSTISVSFTVFFAYNSSLEQPVSSKLIFAKPERSVFMLNLLTQITIFCLAEVTSTVFDAIRWVMACRDSGISALTFLVMSRATNVMGVLCLIFGRGTKPRGIQRDGHRLWGSQRYHLKVIALIKDCSSC